MGEEGCLWKFIKLHNYDGCGFLHVYYTSVKIYNEKARLKWKRVPRAAVYFFLMVVYDKLATGVMTETCNCGLIDEGAYPQERIPYRLVRGPGVKGGALPRWEWVLALQRPPSHYSWQLATLFSFLSYGSRNQEAECNRPIHQSHAAWQWYLWFPSSGWMGAPVVRSHQRDPFRGGWGGNCCSHSLSSEKWMELILDFIVFQRSRNSAQ